MTQSGPSDDSAGSRLRLWESAATAFRANAGVIEAPGSNARTDAARRRTRPDPLTTTVDLYLDPACPYTWLASRWLVEVERLCRVDLRFHVMSLRMLNEGRIVDPGERERVDRSIGPARVATAVWVHHGGEALRAWHTAFGTRIFDEWRFPSSEEYAAACTHALEESGLPVRLGEAAASAEYDEPLRRSHDEGTVPVGVDGGTPVVHVDGVAYFGPVLNGVPRGDAALALFEAVRLLAGCPDFYELKRTRTAPPELR